MTKVVGFWLCALENQYKTVKIASSRTAGLAMTVQLR